MKVEAMIGGVWVKCEMVVWIDRKGDRPAWVPAHPHGGVFLDDWQYDVLIGDEQREVRGSSLRRVPA